MTEELAQQFASDNYAGICPEAWAAMRPPTAAMQPPMATTRGPPAPPMLFASFSKPSCEVYFVFNGTAANSLALASLCQSYHGVICRDQAHVETDECGAPEFFSNGSKLLVAPGADGKLTPAAIHELATRRQDIHYPKPRVVTITQSTETGRVYTVAELQAISAACKAHGLPLHMDGARFANACASLGCTPAELTWKSGVDVLCFGGTKNGMAVGEAVLFFDRDSRRRLRLPLQAGRPARLQDALPGRPLGRHAGERRLARNARHANRCARYFAEQIAGIPGISIISPSKRMRSSLKLQTRSRTPSRPRLALLHLHRRRRPLHVCVGL